LLQPQSIRTRMNTIAEYFTALIIAAANRSSNRSSYGGVC
jgi:hypothetical protein